MQKKSILNRIFGRRITIMIVPHHEMRVFQFKIPVFLAVFFAVLTISIVSYSIYIIKNNIDYKVAQESIKTLKEKVYVLNEEFNRLQGRVQKFAEQEKKLREMIGYKDKRSLIEEKGTGGPTKADQNILEKMLSSEIKKQDIKKSLNDVMTEIDMRERNFKEMEKYVSNLRSIWAATPKGMPLKGYITSKFGFRKMVFDYMGDSDKKEREDWHAGIDIANKIGSKIYATAPGKVVFTGKLGGYGLLVIIDHGYGFSTRYGHCSKILVKKGDEIKTGDVVALVGLTGNTTGPHAHYEVRKYGTAIDPATLDPDIYTSRR